MIVINLAICPKLGDGEVGRGVGARRGGGGGCWIRESLRPLSTLDAIEVVNLWVLKFAVGKELPSSVDAVFLLAANCPL